MSSSRTSTPTLPIPEKRREPRISTRIEIAVVVRKRRVRFTIDDVSASGARIVGPLPLALGEHVHLVLDSNAGQREIEAEVVRVHTPDLLTDQAAVRFLSLPPDCEGAIRDLVERTIAAGGQELELDDDGVTHRLPRMMLAMEEDAATIRFVKKRSDG